MIYCSENILVPMCPSVHALSILRSQSPLVPGLSLFSVLFSRALFSQDPTFPPAFVFMTYNFHSPRVLCLLHSMSSLSYILSGLFFHYLYFPPFYVSWVLFSHPQYYVTLALCSQCTRTICLYMSSATFSDSTDPSKNFMSSCSCLPAPWEHKSTFMSCFQQTNHFIFIGFSRKTPGASNRHGFY